MTEPTLFSQLELLPAMEKAISELGFAEATPIQAAAIPLIRTGVDVIARSQTGTGKTLAFAIPALEAIDKDAPIGTVQALILCPTRELAQQAGDEIRKLARFMPHIHPAEVFGGADMRLQIHKLRNANVVIGTPGRVIDHMGRKTLKLGALKMLVLDEADEMLKMGFKEELETILMDTPAERQTVLFSATMPPLIRALTKQYQKDPQMIEINKEKVTLDNITQRIVEVPSTQKRDALRLLLGYHKPTRAIVFCNTKQMVDELTEYLVQDGNAAESIHGDLKQSQRTSVMNRFKQGQVAILVATDVAARGIDVNDIDYVFNYDIPMKAEEYVHRIGRTGRAGKSGCAITLCCGRRQISTMQWFARQTNSFIKPETLPTPKDLKSRERARNLEKMRDALAQDATDYSALVEALMEEGFLAEQIAAAALKQLFPPQTLQNVAVSLAPSQKPQFDGQDRPKQRKSSRSNANFVDVVINIGSADRVTVNHLVGAITEQSGVSSKVLGKIDISEDSSVVGVASEYLDQVLDTVQGVKICGKRTKTVPLVSNRKPKSKQKTQPPMRKSKGYRKERKRG